MDCARHRSVAAHQHGRTVGGQPADSRGLPVCNTGSVCGHESSASRAFQSAPGCRRIRPVPGCRPSMHALGRRRGRTSLEINLNFISLIFG